MIAFSCPHCGAQLQVKDSMARRTGPCPRCSQVVQAPPAGAASLSGSAPSHSTLRPPLAGQDTAPSLPQLAPHPDYPFLAPADGPDELGRLGPYRILKVLGSGAMGVIFEAEDPHLKRRVALKVMKPSLVSSAEFRRRFRREGQLAAAIDHEHLVTIYQVGEDRGVPFLAMQLLQGETLEDRLNRSGGRLPPPEVLRIGREIAAGLAAAHAQGLVHRDIKPANVWLEAGRDRVKVLDFGLARGTGEEAHFTQAGAVIGTPAYMAPEQANAEEVDARCDLFSLGAVLYRAGTGRLPFSGKDTLSILSALATTTPEPPHAIDPSLPQAFSDLVMGLLAKDPDERPPSARDVVQAIERIERGEAAPAASPEGARAARGRAEGRAAPPPAAVAGGTEGAGSGVKSKGPKKARPPRPRRKKRPEAERDWGPVVLVAGLVLLGLAILLLVAVLRHAGKARAAASEDPPLDRAARAVRRESTQAVAHLTTSTARRTVTDKNWARGKPRTSVPTSIPSGPGFLPAARHTRCPGGLAAPRARSSSPRGTRCPEERADLPQAGEWLRDNEGRSLAQEFLGRVAVGAQEAAADGGVDFPQGRQGLGAVRLGGQDHHGDDSVTPAVDRQGLRRADRLPHGEPVLAQTQCHGPADRFVVLHEQDFGYDRAHEATFPPSG